MLTEILGAFGGGGGGMTPDGPISTSAKSTFQGGSLVIGAKLIGGKDNTAGAASAAQTQSPVQDNLTPESLIRPAPSLPPWLPWAAAGAILVIIAALAGGRRR